ncbi:MAG: bacteriocin [Spirochaetales bacterium]|nr:bacteriocin [Spirochaetales bacterium]
MKNYVKLSAIKLNENEMKQIIGGEGNQQKQQGPPQPVLRYAIVPLYGIVVAKVE